MKRLLRLAKEFFRAVYLYKNFWVYCLARAGFPRGRNVVVKLRAGARYAISPNTNHAFILSEICDHEVYDRLKRFVRDNSVVVDIGANIGVFSVRAAYFAKKVRVVSYEPFPANFEMLRENVRINGLENGERMVVPNQKAVSGARGELELFFSPGDSGLVSQHNQSDKGHTRSVKVPAVTLADVFSDNNITTCDFLKMDCEGAEEDILLNAPAELFDRIRSITLEWHYDLNKMTIDEFRSFLEKKGYQTAYDSSTITLWAWRD